jgi:hypothetical protein
MVVAMMPMKPRLPLARAALLAASLGAFQPMTEGCANLPPVSRPGPDSGVMDGGRRPDAGAIGLPDSGGRPSCKMDSGRLYAEGGPAAFDGELFVLESSSGHSAQISVSDAAGGASTFVSIPEWGSQAIRIAGKTMTIFVNEVSDAPPSWADIDIYGC